MATMPDKHIDLQCVHCGHVTPFIKPVPACPKCGENILRAKYDLKRLRETGWIDKVLTREPGMWRYHELLPVVDPAGQNGEEELPRLRDEVHAPILAVDSGKKSTGSAVYAGLSSG